MCIVYLFLGPLIIIGAFLIPSTFVFFLEDGNPVPLILCSMVTWGSYVLIRKAEQRIKAVSEEEYTKNKEYGSHHSTLLDIDNDDSLN